MLRMVKLVTRWAFSLLVTLWAGGMWMIGFVVTPVIFATLDDRTLAGHLAGRMFEAIGWVGMFAAAYILVFMFVSRGANASKTLTVWLVAAMLLATLSIQFGIQPMLAQMKLDALPLDVMSSPLHDDFAHWHGISSLLYVFQSLLGVVLVLHAKRILSDRVR